VDVANLFLFSSFAFSVAFFICSAQTLALLLKTELVPLVETNALLVFSVVASYVLNALRTLTTPLVRMQHVLTAHPTLRPVKAKPPMLVPLLVLVMQDISALIMMV